MKRKAKTPPNICPADRRRRPDAPAPIITVANDRRRPGFNDGVNHIITLAEKNLAQELGLPNRESLATSGKLPAWWIATLAALFPELPQKQKDPGRHKQYLDTVEVKL